MKRCVDKSVTANDCVTCGACCGPPYVARTYVDLTATDLLRLTAAQRRRYVGETRRRPALVTVLGSDGCVCAALRGRVGTQVACAVYERRPDACRRFAPGSSACLTMRADVGIPDR